MKIVYLLFLAFGLSGCLPSVQGVSQFTSEAEHQSRLLQCKRLTNYGSSSAVMTDINAKMAEIKQLIEVDSTDALAIRSKVILLGEEIKKDADLLTQITDPQNTLPLFEQNILWSIRLNEILGNKWKISHVKIKDIYNQEGLNLLAPNNFRVFRQDREVKIQLLRKTSLLDVCEFQQTIGVIIELELTNGDLQLFRQFKLGTLKENF